MGVGLIIAIYVCGLLAMIVEMFIPGMVIGTLGFLAVMGSIGFAIAGGYKVTALVLVLCTLALVPVFFAVWKGVIGRFFALKGGEGGFRPSTQISEDMVGLEGEALTLLRPSGIARLDGRRCDVVTRGEMLAKGERVKVIEVSGNRIVVKKA